MYGWSNTVFLALDVLSHENGFRASPEYNSILVRRERVGVKNVLVEKVSHKLLMYGILACSAVSTTYVNTLLKLTYLVPFLYKKIESRLLMLLWNI